MANKNEESLIVHFFTIFRYANSGRNYIKSQSKILIRTEASMKIGTGHVMRCLTLAQELRRKGAEVEFVCSDNPGHLCNEIASNDFKVTRLDSKKLIPSISTSFLNQHQEIDANLTIRAINDKLPLNWIIVDHYELGLRWEKILREFTERIMVIDDLANRNHDADFLLDQNYFLDPANRYINLLPDYCQMLLGPRFALIRSEIEQAKKFCRMRGAGANRVLVYFGGSDIDDLTSMTLAALSSRLLRYLWVEVVIGPNNQNRKSIEKLIRSRKRTRLSIQPTTFTELMLRSDFCVGAGGTTTWERLCLDLPSIVITVADNQEPFIRQLDKDGYLVWAGTKNTISTKDLERKITDQVLRLNDPNSIPYIPHIVDGLGAKRVAEKLHSTSIQKLRLRKSTFKDIEQYFFWANDQETRNNSFQDNLITWEEHVQWFKHVMASKNIKMYVLEADNGLPLGQVRFTSDDEAHAISFSLDILVRGRNYGVQILKMGIEKMCRNSKINTFIGKVKNTNIASRKIFNKLGFYETFNNGIHTFTKTI